MGGRPLPLPSPLPSPLPLRVGGSEVGRCEVKLRVKGWGTWVGEGRAGETDRHLVDMAHSSSPHRSGRRGRGNRSRGRGRGRQDRDKNQAEKQTQWTKLAVRGLPAGLTREAFLEHVQGLLGEETIGWCHYLPGKDKGGKRCTSTALVGFTSETGAREFQDKMQGHTFVDGTAREHNVDVELAPCQRVPRPTRRKDPLEGTLEADPHYQQFLQGLEEENAALPRTGVSHVTERPSPSDGKPAVVVTPLMEYLRKKHEKRNKSQSKGKVKKTSGEAKEASRAAKASKGDPAGEPRSSAPSVAGGAANSSAGTSGVKASRHAKGTSGSRSRSKKGASHRTPSEPGVVASTGKATAPRPSKRPSPSQKQRKGKPADPRPRADGPSHASDPTCTPAASVKLLQGGPSP